MAQILSSIPVNNSSGFYLNDPLYVVFDKTVELSYLISDFMKLYRTNKEVTEFYEAIGTDISAITEVPGIDGEVNGVRIKPLANLTPNSYYLFLIVGGETGIVMTDGDHISENASITFQAGSIVRPVSTDDPPVVPPGDIFTPGGIPDSYTGKMSNDIFAQTARDSRIRLTGVIPENNSVGVRDLTTITLIYDDDIDPATPVNIITGKYSGLPFELDPFSNRNISISNVTISRNTISFNIGTVFNDHPLNTEFTFRIPRNVVRGVNRRGFDDEERLIKYLSPLSPVYASPDQIRSRLSSWSDAVDVQITDFNLYKLILEKSLYVQDIINRAIAAGGNSLPIDQRIIQVNQAVICLVLLELLGFDALINGGIKSRELLATKVVYNETSADDIQSALEECIRENLPEVPVSNGYYAFNGIKSGVHMPRDKKYGVYR